jgi:hypothetical protein
MSGLTRDAKTLNTASFSREDLFIVFMQLL